MKAWAAGRESTERWIMQGEENERYESRDRDKNTSDWFLCGEPGAADACLSGGQEPSGPAEL